MTTTSAESITATETATAEAATTATSTTTTTPTPGLFYLQATIGGSVQYAANLDLVQMTPFLVDATAFSRIDDRIVDPDNNAIFWYERSGGFLVRTGSFDSNIDGVVTYGTADDTDPNNPGAISCTGPIGQSVFQNRDGSQDLEFDTDLSSSCMGLDLVGISANA